MPDTNNAAAANTAPAGTNNAGEGNLPSFLADEKGNLREGWFESLSSDDLKTAPALKNFKTLEGLAKSFLSAQKMVGADKIVLPNEHSTKEERDEFLRKIGRPDTPEDYGFKPPTKEELPEGATYNEELDKAFAKKAHELGLTKEQANALRQWHNEAALASAKSSEEVMAKSYEEAQNALRKEWGKAYEANLDLANKAVRTFDPKNKLIELGLANDPDVVRMFAQIGKAISEDKLVVADAGRTPASAKQEINSIMGNPKHPYFDKDHPAHKDAVAKVAELFAQANPQ